jgi:hypothetical protein
MNNINENNKEYIQYIFDIIDILIYLGKENLLHYYNPKSHNIYEPTFYKLNKLNSSNNTNPKIPDYILELITSQSLTSLDMESTLKLLIAEYAYYDNIELDDITLNIIYYHLTHIEEYFKELDFYILDLYDRQNHTPSLTISRLTQISGLGITRNKENKKKIEKVDILRRILKVKREIKILNQNDQGMKYLINLMIQINIYIKENKEKENFKKKILHVSKKNIEQVYRNSNLFRYIFFINGCLLGHFLSKDEYNKNNTIFKKVMK